MGVGARVRVKRSARVEVRVRNTIAVRARVKGRVGLGLGSNLATDKSAPEAVLVEAHADTSLTSCVSSLVYCWNRFFFEDTKLSPLICANTSPITSSTNTRDILRVA